ncbi:response regulator [Candidatus Saccharibacteria bacterium]|nr:response regulator [Candidatus Saccharibacteria bacterium]
MIKVLFVEPDRSLGEIYLKYFTKLGYQVKWAQSSNSALEFIDNFNPDLIVLELQMTSHNGLELMYEIRSYPDWGNIKIMLNTSVKETMLKKSPTYKQLGVGKYTYKPNTTLQEMAVSIEALVTA